MEKLENNQNNLEEVLVEEEPSSVGVSKNSQIVKSASRSSLKKTTAQKIEKMKAPEVNTGKVL